MTTEKSREKRSTFWDALLRNRSIEASRLVKQTVPSLRTS